VLGHVVICAKMADAIEMPFPNQTRVGPKNLVLDAGPDLRWKRALCSRGVYPKGRGLGEQSPTFLKSGGVDGVVISTDLLRLDRQIVA